MNKLTTILTVGLIYFTACKKQEIQGPQGDPGTPGGGGNSSISSKKEFTVNSNDWSKDTIEMCWKIVLDMPAITQEVADNGAVKVFVKDKGIWTELPFTSGDLFTQFAFETGKLYLKYINIEGQISFAAPSGSYRMLTYTQVP
jgi:hypothetical protein